MKGNKTTMAIGVTIAVIFSGVIAASIARVYLVEPTQAFAQQHAGQAAADPLVDSGKAVFKVNCAGCHATDTTEGKFAPGFKGLSKTRKLPVSGRPATEEHIRNQIRKPVKDMPPFDKLSDNEVKSVTAYLLTL